MATTEDTENTEKESFRVKRLKDFFNHRFTQIFKIFSDFRVFSG